MAEGFLHYFEGWIIFIACLSILILGMWFLNKVGKRPASFAASFGMPADPQIRSENLEQRTREIPKPFIACVALILVSLAVIKAIDTRDEVIPVREQFVSFPLYFNGWIGEQDNLKQIVSDKLALTDYFSRDSDIHQFLDTYAWAMVKAGINLEEAVVILNENVKESGNVGIYHYHLGEGLRKQGEVDGAKLHLNKAIELEKADSRVAVEAKKSLQLVSQ